MTEPNPATPGETTAGRHVLDVLTAAGKTLTITDIAARLFANPTRVTSVVIALFESGELIRETDTEGNITITKFGIVPPGSLFDVRATGPESNTETSGKPSPYPRKGKADLTRENRAEGASGG